MENIQDSNIKFLAEKIETQEEYCEAKQLGYNYFQGYYLSKPQILVGYEPVSLKKN